MASIRGRFWCAARVMLGFPALAHVVAFLCGWKSPQTAVAVVFASIVLGVMTKGLYADPWHSEDHVEIVFWEAQRIFVFTICLL